MKDQNRVFVSYGHVEEEICKKICAYLENEGFKPWVDTSKLQHGMLWRDEIRKGIEDSGQVVVNSTPFVRQYGILSNKWGVLLCQKEYQTNDIRQNSKSW